MRIKPYLLISRYLLLNVSLLICFSAFSQKAKILHYTETSGFDHNTRVNSLNMFRSFPNVDVVNDNTGTSFDTLNSLLNYDLIVFSNTSGDAILDSTQRSHFEIYMMNGGNLLGIHAATDTYRHSTANGNNTGSWDFYPNTIGGSVQQSPNHVAGTPNYNIRTIRNHASTLSLPNPWAKNEEYYYWENGFLDSNIQIVLEVEQTVGPNNQVNSYDSARAVSWYKESITPQNNRIFYTSMGHANSNYTIDTLFQKHIKQAMEWCIGRTTDLNGINGNKSSIQLRPNPADDYSILYFPNGHYELNLFRNNGKLVKHWSVKGNNFKIDLSSLKSGIYILNLVGKNSSFSSKLIVE